MKHMFSHVVAPSRVQTYCGKVVAQDSPFAINANDIECGSCLRTQGYTGSRDVQLRFTLTGLGWLVATQEVQ